jgi:hypothetical protein
MDVIDHGLVEGFVKAAMAYASESERKDFLARCEVKLNCNLTQVEEGLAVFVLGKVRAKGRLYAIGELYDTRDGGKRPIGSCVLVEDGREAARVTDPAEIAMAMRAMEAGGEDVLRPNSEEMAFGGDTFVVFRAATCALDGEPFANALCVIDADAGAVVDVAISVRAGAAWRLVEVPPAFRDSVGRLALGVSDYLHLADETEFRS